MKIIDKPIDSLINYEFNGKDHPRAQIDALVKSINEFGFNVPVIVDKDNVIIAGHGRVIAAHKAGLTKVPCVVKDDLTEKQIRKYRLLDNKISELSLDNVTNIKLELEAIGDVDLSQLFYDLEIDDTIGTVPGQEWVGMPEYHQDDLTPFRQVIVSFQSQADVDLFSKLVGQKITDKTKSLWYPYVAPTPMMDKVYTNNEDNK